MRDRKDTELKTDRRPSWRDYQASLKRPRRPAISRKMAALGAMVVVAAYSLYVGFLSPAASSTPEKTGLVEVSKPEPVYISKTDVQLLLENVPQKKLAAKQIDIPVKGHRFQIETSMDTGLQEDLENSLDLKNSRYIGIVVMDADSGRILAMVGFDKITPGANPCLRSTFPAASIFKMVTAAAAVDYCGYSAGTKLHFNGYQHTLYKRQLKESVNQYTNTVTLERSFARSVNPVFGKLGLLKIGKSVLEQYADSFGFNQPINFELPVQPSHLQIGNDRYNWAEIACGFNNDTTLSPLHGAMIASAVVNDGRLKAPTIIDTIRDETGKTIYQSQDTWHGRAMTERAAATLARMMKTTVNSGTARKVFRGYRRNQTLSHLEIGGKTGSIFNRAHDARFDWFVGFARNKDNTDRIAVAVLVAHEEFIGIRAGQYARRAMTHYFKKQLADVHKKTTSSKSKS